MVPNMRRSAMDTPKAQATRLRRDFDDLISKLIDDENTARSDYEREVPQLEQQICEKEEAIERIQREIEVGRNRIIQLRDAIRAATEVRREVEAIFRCRSESKSPPSTAPTNILTSNAEVGTATAQPQEETAEDIHSSSSTERPTTQPPATGWKTTRSGRPLRESARARQVREPPADQPAPGRGKRKRDAEGPSEAERGRLERRRGTPINQNGDRRKRRHQPRTIQFSKVFQRGGAKYKHLIVEHPEEPGIWFILLCDDHSTHFGEKPILGAINHLRSKDHGRLVLDTSDAIEKLGIRVLNCNAARAKRNNDAFLAALKSGYEVLERRSSDDPGDVPHSATTTEYEDDNNREEEREPTTRCVQPRVTQFDGISDPVVGELYLAYWRGASPGWYAAVVLPLGNFEALGISGTIPNTILTKSHIPVCYESDQKTHTISGWAEGYEDGGAKVTMRKFPVMYFDDDQEIPMEGLLVPPPGFLAWVPAKQLRAFGEYGPGGSPARGYDVAQLYSQRQKSSANSTSHIEDTLSKGTSAAECESRSTASVQSSIAWDTANRNAADVSEDSGGISRGQSNDPASDAEPEHDHDGGVGDSTTETDRDDITTVAPESRHLGGEENNPHIARMEDNINFTSDFPMAASTAASWRLTPAEISELAEKPASTSPEEHNASPLELQEVSLTLACRAMAAMSHRQLAPGTEASRADNPPVHKLTTPNEKPSSVRPTARTMVFDPVRSSSAQSQSLHMPQDNILKNHFRQPTVPEVEDDEVRRDQSPVTISDDSPVRAAATQQSPPVSFELSFPATQTFGVATHPAGRSTPRRHQFILPAPATGGQLERASPAPGGRPFSQIPLRHSHPASGFASRQTSPGLGRMAHQSADGSRPPPVPQGFGLLRMVLDGGNVGEDLASGKFPCPDCHRPFNREVIRDKHIKTYHA